MTLASAFHKPGDDPLAWRMELQEALSQAALGRFEGDETVDRALADRAAYRLAVALCRCRLFGVDLEGEAGSKSLTRSCKTTSMCCRWLPTPACSTTGASFWWTHMGKPCPGGWTALWRGPQSGWGRSRLAGNPTGST